jgi:hypothetical protein
MAAGSAVHARGEARAAFIDRALACDDWMTAKMPPWYGGASAGARDRGLTGGPRGARLRRGRRATHGAGEKSRRLGALCLGKTREDSVGVWPWGARRAGTARARATLRLGRRSGRHQF